MKRVRLHLPWSLLAGVALLSATCGALKGNVLVLNKLRAKPDDTPPPSPEDKVAVDEAAAGNGTLAEAAAAAAAVNASKPALTGIPQLDYVHDPNLPRELNGYNLKDYPFYDRVPDDMDFKCDGLHDGFYASVPHKCQVYHHCLFGTRYDFLCANYTAFDQKTFICHFVSEVDCVNSPKYFNRNEALYKAATTTTPSPPPTRATQPPPRRQADPEEEVQPAPRRRRPYRRRRPVYDYVYDDEYDEDVADYEEDAAVTQGRSSSVRASRPLADEVPRRKRPRPQQRPAAIQDDFQDASPADPAADLKPKSSSSVYERPRMAPRIRRPVPLNERDKYDYSKHPNIVTTPVTVEAHAPRAETNSRPKSPQSPTGHALEDDYYYDEEEYVPPSRSAHLQGSSRAKTAQDYYPEEGDIERRPPKIGAGSPRRTLGQAGSRKRVTSAAADEADEYDDFYDDVPRRVVRPSSGRRRVKDNLREDEDYVRRPVQANGYKARLRSKPQRYEPDDYFIDEEPVPATRPAYITRPQGGRDGYSNRRRPQQQADTTATDYVPSRAQPSSDYKRPAGRRPSSGQYTTGYASDADYYDDTEELLEEPENYRNHPKQTGRGGGSSGARYEATAREDDITLPVSKTRQYASNSRQGGTNFPSHQQQAPQYSSGKLQPTRNYPPPTSLAEDEESLHLQQPLVHREKPAQEERDRFPATQRNNKAHVRGHESVEPPAQLVPKGFTPQSTPKTEESYFNVNPSRTIPASGGDEYRRRPISEDSFSSRTQSPTVIGSNSYQSKPKDSALPRSPSPSTPTGSNSYQPKAMASGDAPTRTSYGKYRSASGDTESIIVSSSTTERTPDTLVSYKSTTPKDSRGNKTADSPALSSRGGSNHARPLGKLAMKPVVRERENVHIIPEDEPLRHNLADVNDDDDDVARNDVLSPSIQSTRSIPSGPAYMKSGDGQPRFRVKLFKSKLTPQINSQDNQSQSLPKNTSKHDGSTDIELSSSLAGGGGSGGGDSRGYLVTSASQTQYTRAPFPTHSKDIVLEGSSSYSDDITRSNPSVPSVSSFNQRPEQLGSAPRRASYAELPTSEYVYTPQSRPQLWSQQRKRSSSQYLSSPN